MAVSAKDLMAQDYAHLADRLKTYQEFRVGATAAQTEALEKARLDYAAKLASIKGQFDESLEMCTAQIDRLSALLDEMPKLEQARSPNFVD